MDEPSETAAVPSPERRRWTRFATTLQASVQFGLPPSDVSSLITDASAGGLFIALSPPPEVGTHLIINIKADGERPVVVAGRVTRRVIAPLGAPVPTGVGVEITGASPEWIETCARWMK